MRGGPWGTDVPEKALGRLQRNASILPIRAHGPIALWGPFTSWTTTNVLPGADKAPLVHACVVVAYFFTMPTSRSKADTEKMNGHSWKGMKSILKPVNSDRTAIDTNMMIDNE
jgi:hypothetical protein